MRFADIDAVTLDAYGTLVELADPVPTLDRGLRERGVEHDPNAIAHAFAAESAFYRERSHEGRDAESLAQLRLDCVAVFLDALGAELPPEEFVEPYLEALRFRLLPGTREAVRSLRRHGLALAIVSNWDIGLHEHLAALGFPELVIVTSAEAGAPKPDPAPFRLAVDELRVRPERTLHVGDSDSDERGALAAGLRFAATPLGGVLG